MERVVDEGDSFGCIDVLGDQDGDISPQRLASSNRSAGSPMTKSLRGLWAAARAAEKLTYRAGSSDLQRVVES
ncbi:hypothetical protein SAMN05421642_12456 [Rhodococcoides kyotonense]|uniref:Uncharacterized protein n=1 Tax=Rhodococcoides kyotonense TaxID=398843 RepID=A0A239MXL9_9NOCA|nr:hypothetical protein SAMN05421642_12456 [Rhodococcus kyotonensis]